MEMITGQTLRVNQIRLMYNKDDIIYTVRAKKKKEL